MKNAQRKRILVTGGAGFLGSHLCERLLQGGHDVLCVDNFYTGSKDHISHLIGNPYFELLRHDITFPLYVEIDEIYNLACPASPVHYQFDPVQTIKTSVHGSINMLGLAKGIKAKILQASTSEVYGDPRVHPQVESYWGHVNPIGLRSCYDEGKRCTETLFMDYRRHHKVVTKVARIFNTYGPRMHPDDGRVVANFIMQALKGERLTVFGDGRQTPLVLLCLRSNRGAGPADGVSRWIRRSGEPWQSARVLDPRARAENDPTHRLQIEDPIPSPPER
jgi:UDP-glucuronate decarboxylase